MQRPVHIDKISQILLTMSYAVFDIVLAASPKEILTEVLVHIAAALEITVPRSQNMHFKIRVRRKLRPRTKPTPHSHPSDSDSFVPSQLYTVLHFKSSTTVDELRSLAARTLLSQPSPRALPRNSHSEVIDVVCSNLLFLLRYP